MENAAERYKTKLTTSYHSIFINPDTNLKTSNLSTPKENPYVEPANEGTNCAATGNKQRGRPLNHLCTHWFHYYYILYFIFVYFIIILITIMIIFVYIFFIISNIFIFYYLFLILIFKFLLLILFYYFIYFVICFF